MRATTAREGCCSADDTAATVEELFAMALKGVDSAMFHVCILDEHTALTPEDLQDLRHAIRTALSPVRGGLMIARRLLTQPLRPHDWTGS